MNRASLALLVAAAALAGGCGDHAAPAPPSADGTFWLAPNGSEVVLKLTTTQPTSPF